MSMIYSFTDDIYRIRLNKPSAVGISDKRRNNRGKNIRSYTTICLKKIFEYLIKVQYIYDLSESMDVPNTKEGLVQNIKWIFLDQGDIILI